MVLNLFNTEVGQAYSKFLIKKQQPRRSDIIKPPQIKLFVKRHLLIRWLSAVETSILDMDYE